jgi:iron complex outermembrane receptor protein
VGGETSAQYQINDRVRVRGGVAYVKATFREGPYAGNDVPLVSRWTGNAGMSFDIVRKVLVLDLTGSLHGQRRMDNDQINQQPKLPAIATVDAKLGGEYDRFFWSTAVLNVFDTKYYDYAIASGGVAAGPGFPAGAPPTIGSFSAYPLPGRTFMLRGGMTF